MADKLFLRKVSGGAIPDDDETKEIYDTLKIGQVFEVLPWTERNLNFHKKMIRLVNLAIHGSNKWQGMDWRGLLGIIQLDIGEYTECMNFKGEFERWPKSIAFRNMSEIAFTKLYKKVSQYMLTNLEMLIPGLSPAKFERYVEEILFRF